MLKIAGIILVGGKASRLNGENKCDLRIGNKSCLEWTLDIFDGQVEKIALSVGNQDRYNHGSSHSVVFDWPCEIENPGVAYAILGSLNWAKEAGFDAIITTPVDTPLLPKTYAARLRSNFDNLAPTVCTTPKGLQGLHAIWPVACWAKLHNIVVERGILKISKIHKGFNSAEIDFPHQKMEAFININDDVSLDQAQKIWANSNS